MIQLLLQEGTTTAEVKKHGWDDVHRNCKPTSYFLLLWTFILSLVPVLELPNVDSTCNAEIWFAESQLRITKQTIEG